MGTQIPTNLNQPLITRMQAFSGSGLSLPFIVTSAVTTPGVENATAIAADMASLGSAGGTVWFPPGTYQCTNLNVPLNIELRGSHSTLYGVSSRLQAQPGSRLPCLNILGASGNHTQNVTLIDLSIMGDGSGPPCMPAVVIQYASYIRVYRCQIGNVQSAALQCLEVWDSRISDCDFEYCGSSDGTIGSINMLQGAGDFTNSIVIENCRFESFFGTAIFGVGNTNKIFINNIKMESIYSTKPYMSFNDCVHVGLNNVQCTIDGALTLPNLLSIVNCYGIFGHVSFENNTGNAVLTNYVLLQGSNCTKLDILILQGSPAPTGGYIVGWDGTNSANTSLACQTVLSTPLHP